MLGTVKNCESGPSTGSGRAGSLGERGPFSISGGRLGSEAQTYLGGGKEAAAQKAGEAGLVEGQGGQVPERPRRHLQRQRSLSAKRSADDGRLPAPPDGRVVPRRMGRDDRDWLP